MPPIHHRRNFLVSLLLILFPIFLYAEFGLSLSNFTSIDGNVFRNYEQLQDVVNQPEASLWYQKNYEAVSLRAFYTGAFTAFKKYGLRQYQFHKGGGLLRWVIGGSGPVLQSGVEWGRRFNETEYSYYNYMHASAYAMLRFDQKKKGSLTFSLTGQQRHYFELAEFDFVEYRGIIKKNFYLPSRTTLIGTGQLGYEHFLESTFEEQVIQSVIPAPALFDEATNTSGRGRGRGNGNGAGNWNTTETDQDAGSESVVSERVVRVESPGQNIYQMEVSLRIAQSLFKKTGLAVEGSFSRKLEGSARSLSYQDSGYETDDYLFDDPYRYESEELLLEITQMLPLKFTLKAGYHYHNKQYDNQANDFEGNPVSDELRNDIRQSTWIQLSKPFMIGSIVKLKLNLSYLYLLNTSNDAYYDYFNKMSLLGIEMNL